MTPEENRRRLAQERCGATKANYKLGNSRAEEETMMTPQEMIFAAKMARPGGGKPTGRKGRSHSFSATSRPGVRNPPKAQRLG